MSHHRSASGARAAAAPGQSAALHSLFIVNKAGGLIFHRDFLGRSPGGGNDTLRLASTFHAMHVVAQDLCPVATDWPTGISSLEAGSFRLECFHTQTGTKFVAVAGSGASRDGLERLLREVYVAYCDAVLKNPFTVTDQVIRSRLFDAKLRRLVHGYRG